MSHVVSETAIADLIQFADSIEPQTAALYIRELVAAYRWNRRAVELVSAEGSLVRAAITPGHVVIVDGRTGQDSCEQTAERCFESLFEEQDGGDSPFRLHFTDGPEGIGFAVTGGPNDCARPLPAMRGQP